jgi:hypothetical protein
MSPRYLILPWRSSTADATGLGQGSSPGPPFPGPPARELLRITDRIDGLGCVFLRCAQPVGTWVPRTSCDPAVPGPGLFRPDRWNIDPIPGRSQPARWSIEPVPAGSMEHRAGSGREPGRNRWDAQDRWDTRDGYAAGDPAWPLPAGERRVFRGSAAGKHRVLSEALGFSGKHRHPRQAQAPPQQAQASPGQHSIPRKAQHSQES